MKGYVRVMGIVSSSTRCLSIYYYIQSDKFKRIDNNYIEITNASKNTPEFKN